jgi:hypothetical protein
MRDALRRGDIAAGVSHIVSAGGPTTRTAFRLLSASLPLIDGILTDLVPVKIRNATAIYEMRRTDDRLVKSFEIRFAIDGDGIWRLEPFDGDASTRSLVDGAGQPGHHATDRAGRGAN